MTRLRGWNRSAGEPDLATLARRGEMLSLAMLVCAAIVASKVVLGRQLVGSPDAQEPAIYDPNPLVFALRVLWSCAEDVAVGLICVLAGFGLLGLASSGRSRRLVQLAAYGSAAVAIIYQVATMKLFYERHEFLRMDLFWLGGGFTPYPGVVESVGGPVWCAVIFGPLGALGLHRLGQRAYPTFWSDAARLLRPGRVLAAAAAFALAGSAWRAYADIEFDDFARNAHLVLVRSVIEPAPRLDVPIETEAAGSAGDRRTHDPDPRLARPPRNLILIVVESVGTRYFEPYGCPLPTTPNLRRLASRSLTFDNYYASANFSFGSAMALFAGTYGNPLAQLVYDKDAALDLPSAAGHLRRLGYRTYFFGAGGKAVWDHLHTAELFCIPGFDVSRDPNVPFWQRSPRPLAIEDPGYDDRAMFADVRRAVDEPHDRPFAIVMWAYDTHEEYRDGEGPATWPSQYDPPGVRGGRVERAEFDRYLRAIWRVDRFVGRLSDDLEAKGLADDTLIVVTGDHGESFGDHGLLSHSTGLYEDQVHVPLILISPRLSALGSRSRAVGGHVDLWPTIADICALPPHPRWQGRSLIGAGIDDGSSDRGTSGDDRRAFFYGGRPGHCGVRDGRWKYFWDMRKDKHYLFDLSADPGELQNLADARPELRDHLNRRVKAWIAVQERLTRKD